jgi:hypothetical protein
VALNTTVTDLHRGSSPRPSSRIVITPGVSPAPADGNDNLLCTSAAVLSPKTGDERRIRSSS